MRITVTDLMTNMNNKYLSLVKDGSFVQLTKSNKKIVALQSLIKNQEQQLNDGNLTLSKQYIGKLRNIKDRVDPRKDQNPVNVGQTKRDQFKNRYSVYTGTQKGWEYPRMKESQNQ